MHAFLALAAENRPDKIPQAIARAVAHAMLADTCYLISAPENGEVTCFDGFNRVKEENLSGFIFPADQFPEIAASLTTLNPIIINDPSQTEITSQHILSILGQVRAAPSCLMPVISPDGTPLGGLLLISPFSGRQWLESDLTQLTAMSDSIAKILQRVLYLADLEEQLLQQPEPISTVTETPGPWVVEDTGETAAVEATGVTTVRDMEETSVIHTRISKYIHQPHDELTIYKAENDLMLYEIYSLMSNLEHLDQTAIAAGEEPTHDGAREALSRIRDEVRNMLSPLSAITGYHDLLISESVGNLTPMQQRFLDRIRNAADKLHHSIENVSVVAETSQPFALEEPLISTIALQPVIEKSFNFYQQIIHDRGLEIHLQSAADIPEITGKEEEISQVVNKILNSLLAVTPNHSAVHSQLSMQMELDGRKNVLWKASALAQSDLAPGKELDEFSEYLQENVFNLAERLNCQLWMDAAVHTERQVNLLFAAV